MAMHYGQEIRTLYPYSLLKSRNITRTGDGGVLFTLDPSTNIRGPESAFKWFTSQIFGMAARSEKMDEALTSYHRNDAYGDVDCVLFSNWVRSLSILSWEKQTHEYFTSNNREKRIFTQWILETTFGRLLISCYSASIRQGTQCVWQCLLASLLRYDMLMTTESYQASAVLAQQDVDTDKPTNQGEPTQDSIVASNTIVTADAALVEQKGHAPIPDYVVNAVTTQPTSTFSEIVGRWFPLKPVEITTDLRKGAETRWDLPEAMWDTTSICGNTTINLIPFEVFIYGKYDFEFMLVPNSNKFNVGKLVLSVLHDPYEINDLVNGDVGNALQRPHVIVDLATNNEVRLRIPFLYHRPMCRNVYGPTGARGVRPAKMATVYLTVLAPLMTGTGNANSIFIRPLVRMVSAKFAGMSYRTNLIVAQNDFISGAMSGAMSSVDNIIDNPLVRRGVHALVAGLDAFIDSPTRSDRMDKPSEYPTSISVVPRPIIGFATSFGKTVVERLSMNPMAQVPIIGGTPYNNVHKIMSVWGAHSSFSWSPKGKNGTVLWSMPIDPTLRSYQISEITPTPVEYVASMYQYWSGTMELRLDFVSNMFHSGSISITAEYGRPASTEAGEECQAYSSYYKVFHLGEQKSVTYRIPYIFDTVWRRTSTPPYFLRLDQPKATESLGKDVAGLKPGVSANVVVRVVNELRPISNVPSEITVLAFLRAGPDFRVHSLKQNSWQDFKIPHDMDDFPRNYRMEVGYRMDQRMTKTMAQVDDDVDNQDPTAVFRSGSDTRHLITCDLQMDIYAILRRPALIMTNVSLDTRAEDANKYSVTFFIPVQPPSRNMQIQLPGVGDNTELHQNNVWSVMVGFTPQASITNLFRFWRGSTRYTLVWRSGNKDTPIYISYLPHSGVRWVGSQAIKVIDRDCVPYASGIATTMWIPTLNPVITVEVPYDTENIWSLAWEYDSNKNYTWRDKGDTNAGHLLIQPANRETDSKNKPHIDVWWQAGDDYRVDNFVGTVKMRQASSYVILDDSHPKNNVRMLRGQGAAQIQGNRMRVAQADEDFSPEYSGNNASPIQGYLKNAAVNAMLGCVPIVGTSLMSAKIGTDLAMKVNDVSEKVHPILDQVDDRLKEMGPIFANISQATVSLSTCMTNMEKFCSALTTRNPDVSQMANGILSSLGFVGDVVYAGINYTTVLYHFILDLLNVYFHQDWASMGITLMRLFTGLFGVQVCCKVHEWVEQLSQFFTPHIVAQTDGDQDAQLISILVGILGTITGVALSAKKISVGALVEGLTLRLTSASGVAYFVQVQRFIIGIFTLLKRLVYSLLGYLDPETNALRMLADKSEVIENFVRESQLMLDEANVTVISQPHFRTRFWSNVMNAYQIQQLLSKCPNNVASPTLGRLCNDVIKAGREKFLDVSSSPVRYEPIVICIEGPSNIGKSYMTDDLIAGILRELNIGFAVEMIYYRNSGDRFWSGYRDQPVVVYDEWLNIKTPEAMSQQISELFRLKSTALFIPEMAHLEEKKIRASPKVVILLCNNAFPSEVTLVAQTPGATWRRRDILIRATRNERYHQIEQVKDLPSEVQDSFGHLQFQQYMDVTDSQSLGRKAIGYAALSKYLQQFVKRYDAQERINVRKRIDRLQEFLGNADGKYLNLTDPFSLFYGANDYLLQQVPDRNIQVLPSEILEQQVDAIVQTMRESIENPTNQAFPIPNAPENPWSDHNDTTALLKKQHKEKIREQSDDVDFVDCPEYETGSSVIIAGIMKMLEVGWNYIPKWEDICGDIPTIPEDLEVLTTGVQCCICRNTTDMVAICESTEERLVGDRDGIHTMCMQCYTNNRNIGSGTCPMCRSPVKNVVVRKGLLHMLTTCMNRMIVGTNYSVRITREILHTFISLFSTMSRAISASILWHQLVRLILTVDARSFKFYGSFAAISVEYILSDIIRSQSDNEGFEIIPDEYVPPPELTMSFNHQLFKIKCQRIVPSNILECHHGKLNVDDTSLRYAKGFWSFNIGNHQVLRIPDAWCSENCIWKQQPNVQEMFSARYLEKHAIRLRGLVLGTANQFRSQEGTLDAVPYFAYPNWCRQTTIILEEELQLGEKEESWLQWAQGLIPTILRGCGYIVLTCGGLYGIIRIFAPYFENIHPQGGHREYEHEAVVRSRQAVPVTRATWIREQSDVPSVEEVAVRRVADNMVAFLAVKGNGKCCRYNGVGLCDNYAIFPKHYHKDFAAATSIKITFTKPTRGDIDYVYDEKDFTSAGNIDVLIFKMPANTQLFKSILRFFWVDGDISKPIGDDLNLLAPPSSSNQYAMYIPIEYEKFLPNLDYYDKEGNALTSESVIQYNYSKMGACGGMVIRGHHTHPIVAMHIAGMGDGHDGDGYGQIITQELLKEALAGIQQHPIIEQADVDVSEDLSQMAFFFPDNLRVEVQGVVPPSLVPHQPVKSNIVPSAIANIGEVVPCKEPTILGTHDSRYIHTVPPLVAGSLKHGAIVGSFSSTQINRAREALWDMFLSKLKPTHTEPLTVQQAVCGIENVPYMDPMVFTTSAGWPWNSGERKSKLDWMTITRDEAERPVSVVLDPKLQHALDSTAEMRRKGIVPPTVFLDMLKDERRYPEKARKLGGTRVFCASPIDYTIALRQAFMPFMSAFMNDRFMQQHAVGIDRNSAEWARLYYRLYTMNPDLVVGIDYSNFGPGFSAQVAHAAIELMIRWTKEHVPEIDEATLWCLGYESIHSLHICRNVVYRQQAGSPSGAPWTVIINTLVNLLYIIMAWDGLISEADKWELFLKYVCLYAYGDDLIMTVMRLYFERFNQQTIIDWFAKYDIVATDFSKKSDMKKAGSLWSEIDFLQSGFSPHPSRPFQMLAPYKVPNVIDIACWVPKGIDRKEMTRVNCEAALLQLYHNGPIVYEKWKQTINKALISRKIQPLTLTWDDIDDKFYGGVE